MPRLVSNIAILPPYIRRTGRTLRTCARSAHDTHSTHHTHHTHSTHEGPRPTHPTHPTQHTWQESSFSFDFEKPNVSQEALRELIHAEMLNFHPNSGSEDPK